MKIPVGNYTGKNVTVVMEDEFNTFGEYILPPGESLLWHPRLEYGEFVQDGRAFGVVDHGSLPDRLIIHLDDAGKAVLVRFSNSAENIAP